mgnify:CR=1 FL=1
MYLSCITRHVGAGDEQLVITEIAGTFDGRTYYTQCGALTSPGRTVASRSNTAIRQPSGLSKRATDSNGTLGGSDRQMFLTDIAGTFDGRTYYTQGGALTSPGRPVASRSNTAIRQPSGLSKRVTDSNGTSGGSDRCIVSYTHLRAHEAP